MTGPALRGDRLTELARRRFPGHVAAVRQARRFVAGLADSDWPALEDTLLLVSEVASNAVKHSASGDGGSFEITVLCCGPTLRIEVGDQGGASEPAVADATNRAAGILTGGRGLGIVKVLADRWGCHGDELGRVVWFEITAKPDEGSRPTASTEASR